MVPNGDKMILDACKPNGLKLDDIQALSNGTILAILVVFSVVRTSQ